MSDDPVFYEPSDPGPIDPNVLTRDSLKRPLIRVECPNADAHVDEDLEHDDATGRVPSEKRPGKTVQCPKCKGKGYCVKAYTRCTTFVSNLDDRSALEKWQKRIVLIGIAADVEVYEKVYSLTPEADRDELDALAERAFEAGDGYEKARKGTDLHKLSELVDAGQPFPEELWNDDAGAFRPVTLQDRADMAAYVRVRDFLELAYLDRECFVVEDGYGIGGTFDGLAHADLSRFVPHCCDRPRIVDLKTGRTDFGQGKMGMQLGVYSRGSRYDPGTGYRDELGACPHVGIIIALPQGSGDATFMLLDLELGWETVSLAEKVRTYRREVGRGSYVLTTGEVPA